MSSRHVFGVLVPAAVLLLFSAGQASAQCSGMGGQQSRARPQLAMMQQRATLPQLGLQQTALQSQLPILPQFGQTALQSQSPLQLYAAQQYALQQYALQQYALQQQQNALAAALLQQQQQNAALAALLQQQNAAPVQLMAR
jgi:hypothetical protein